MALAESYVAGPTTPAVRDMTFGDLLRKAAEAAPERLALIAGVPDQALRRQWTYAQFYQEAKRTARALLTRFKPGERVAVWAQNIPEWMMLEFGAGMAGMVLVTVNPAFRAKEVEYVLKQSRSAGVFVVKGFRGNPMLETVQAVACPELREIICFDDWDAVVGGHGRRTEVGGLQLAKEPGRDGADELLSQSWAGCRRERDFCRRRQAPQTCLRDETYAQRHKSRPHRSRKTGRKWAFPQAGLPRRVSVDWMVADAVRRNRSQTKEQGIF
jgi:hypothetical protein